MSLVLHTVGLVRISTTSYPIMSMTVNDGTTVSTFGYSGATQNTGLVAAGNGVAVVEVTCPLATALSMASLTPANVASVVFWANRLDGAVKSATGTSWTLAGSCANYISNVSVEQGRHATATVRFVCVSSDGSTDALTLGSGSIPASPSAPTLHTVGTITINGSQVEGLRGWTLATNHREAAVLTDGNLLPTGVEISGGAPTISARIADTSAVSRAAITSSTFVGAQQLTADGVAAGTEKQFAVANGYISVDSLPHTHGEIAEGTVTITGASADGAASAVLISDV